ncbi:MAG: carboxylesterase family protein [Nocardioides sp.]
MPSHQRRLGPELRRLPPEVRELWRDRRAPTGSALVATIAAAVAVTVLVVAGFVVILGPDATTDDPLVVATTEGDLRGVEADGLRVWRGVRYADSPTGQRRWAAPAPAPTWDGVRDADTFGADCLQPEPYTYGQRRLQVRAGSAEDCLFLNVVRPVDGGDRLPVMVWLHGGGFIFGNASSTADSSGPLAQRGMIVVTINYRLGQLGYFAHPALRGTVANFGLLDQTAALTWVRDNIAAFGGDPEQVTLAGGSAGAMSVNALMTAPGADGLFQRAISQSAPGDWRSQTFTQASNRARRAFPEMSAADLRALKPRDLLSSTFNVLTGDAPIIDSVLPERAVDAFATGREVAIPYLVGTTAGEFSDAEFQLAGGDPERVRQRLGGARHTALVAAYGPASYRRHVLDDILFTAPAVALASLHAARAPTFRYRFAVAGADTGHGSEIGYVFDTVADPDKAPVAHAVADYWASFVRSGNPGVPELARWPQAGRGAVMVIGPDGPRSVPRDTWAERVDRLASLLPLDVPLI